MILFDYLDKALLEVEHRDARMSRSPSVWPSEASAELFDKAEAPYIGKCHRASYWRMVGESQTNKTDPIGLRRFRMGRMCESDITQLAKDAGVFVGSGVRTYVKDISLPIETDLVVVDPASLRGFITECKSIYGYYANKEVIKVGRPKMDAVMQLCMYINEIRTGARLRELIAESLAEKARLDALGREHRYRIEVNQENLAKVDAGPLYGKLVYESRDECGTREFNIGIWQDPIDGLHYPTIDGEPYKLFTIESIYTRYQKLQSYWLRAVEEGKKRLRARGIGDLPEDAEERIKSLWWDALGQEVRDLPAEFLPPCDFEWKYPDAKVEKLIQIGAIGKTKARDWAAGNSSRSKKGKPHIGSWRCSYCSYKTKCVSLEYPDMRHLALDLMLADEEEAA